ncbi:MAG: hypothetical protein WBD99_13460 [Thermodesulfobacteriota bacterium]
MVQTRLQKSFDPFKKYTPRWVHNPIRSLLTAIIGPVLFGYRTGYFLSCFKMKAVSKNGEPIPWYTYPCIDFLKYRSYEDKYVLEFGGGQSTIWWAKRAKKVITLEGDREWYEKIKTSIPDNVDLEYVSMENKDINVSQVKTVLEAKQNSKYDVIVIDGLFRYEMIEIALTLMKDEGLIICDNAEGFGLYEGFKKSGLNRVDFFGNAPGVVLPHATSIFFKSSSFAFSSKHPIPVLAKE